MLNIDDTFGSSPYDMINTNSFDITNDAIYGQIVNDPTLRFPDGTTFSTTCPPDAPPTPAGIDSAIYCKQYNMWAERQVLAQQAP